MKALPAARRALAGALVSVVTGLPTVIFASVGDNISIEGCIAQRGSTSALLKSTDDSLVELNLKEVLNSPFPSAPDSCFRFSGESLGQGQNRVYQQAGWVLLVHRIDNLDPHELDKSREVTDNDTSKASQTGAGNN